MTVTHLVETRDELAVLIDPSLLEEVKITSETLLEMSIEGQSLILTPVADDE